jgi:hypothetical protein
MNDTVGVSREDFAVLVREFIRRIRNDDSQQVLAHAILLDLTLEADNAADVLRLDPVGLRTAGEGVRASYRAYQRGDAAQAAELAAAVLSTVLGLQDALADAAGPPTTTISLMRAPDGNYWIRILNEQQFPAAARETAARIVGPLRRNQVCHQLILLGLKDRQADAFVEQVDIGGTAAIHGVAENAARHEADR